MSNLLFLLSGALAGVFRSRRHLVLENLALRQQLTVLKRRRPRPNLGLFDKLFWAAMDFFTVPTMSFGVLYCFFVIGHDRRRILHINVTRHPTSLWIIQQLREAFPFGSAARFLILDRDSKYGLEVPTAVRSLRMIPVRTSHRRLDRNQFGEERMRTARAPCP